MLLIFVVLNYKINKGHCYLIYNALNELSGIHKKKIIRKRKTNNKSCKAKKNAIKRVLVITVIENETHFLFICLLIVNTI